MTISPLSILWLDYALPTILYVTCDWTVYERHHWFTMLTYHHSEALVLQVYIVDTVLQVTTVTEDGNYHTYVKVNLYLYVWNCANACINVWIFNAYCEQIWMQQCFTYVYISLTIYLNVITYVKICGMKYNNNNVNR